MDIIAVVSDFFVVGRDRIFVLGNGFRILVYGRCQVLNVFLVFSDILRLFLQLLDSRQKILNRFLGFPQTVAEFLQVFLARGFGCLKEDRRKYTTVNEE